MTLSSTMLTLMGPAPMMAMTLMGSRPFRPTLWALSLSEIPYFSLYLVLAHCKLISHPRFLTCFSNSGFCTLIYLWIFNQPIAADGPYISTFEHFHVPTKRG